MRSTFFDATIYGLRKSVRVGITFQPLPTMTYEELRVMIHSLEILAERMKHREDKP